MKNEKLLNGFFASLLFIIIILTGFLYTIFTSPGLKNITQELYSEFISGTITASELPNEFETRFNTIFSSNDASLNLFSLIQRILDKHETRNFEVLRSNDDDLYLYESGWPTDEQELNIIANEYELIYMLTLQKFIPRFLGNGARTEKTAKTS